MSAPEHIVDANLALERAGGNANLARDLYQMLQNELPVYQLKIRSLHETGDLPALIEAVHKLHGSATYCGTPELKSAAESLELALKRGGMERYREQLDRLLEAMKEVMQTPELPL
ncbi:MAG: Hpt domain-containing protein [Gammaproteobacteria bacterium]|nr:Hpt domain-containing protein [Gammaproteobacteria bacterium]MCW8973364.1 Hpt domain-containing protein [Gammaproteobacteria bacterium]MCW8994026.1 Hpt domain-containing protein [Gammaproteobacteria bacterium]